MSGEKGCWIAALGGGVAAVALLLLIGRFFFPPPEPGETPAVPAARPPTIEERVRAMVAAMSDEEKIGQMMIVGIAGTAADEATLERLLGCGFGGVVLFDRNLESPEQVRVLTGALQKAAVETFALPLFIAVDEEGGAVARMRHYINAPPPAAQLGRQGDPERARERAEQTAAELRALGFNVNFAPVLDLGLSAGRSYGTRPEVVTRFAAAVSSGYARGGMIFTLKHFPGIGRAKVDPHDDRGEIAASRAALEAADIAPFRALLQSLWMEDFFVMVSHLNYPALDETAPASLSRRIITGLLKEAYGFRGLVITDDLEMGALAKHDEFEVLGVAAAAAGADLILVCHDDEHSLAVYNGMLQALREGRLDRAQVDRSVEKIAAVKLRLADKNAAG